MAHAVEIVEYTDPYCTWCWGSEPVLRHLQETYGDQLTLRFVMGGLVEDQKTFYDAANNIGGEGWASQIAAHWVEASQRHGMPVDVTDFEKAAPTSTWPSNIAYEAAKLQNEETANRYLRRLREAVATESRPIHQTAVLANLAEEVGLDRRQFLADFDGQARDEFTRDLVECRSRGVHGFPTFLVTVDGHERLVRGFRTYDQMVNFIDVLAGEHIERRMLELNDLSLLDFVEKYGSSTVREVSEVFDVPADAAEGALRRLMETGSIVLGSNGLVYRPAVGGACDPATKGCL